ncbi:deoxyribose-phosphate aldolase [Arenimonas sp.]|uniref:deoxyribose-phosphate aldolase n=1 Tax=Arenimonas sp. TaxID=1872635 RepID=UPI0035B18FC8
MEKPLPNRRLMACLDLTRLGDSDTPADIQTLCELAARLPVAPAALCVHPEMITTARTDLDERGLQHVLVATVVNFPDGADDPARCRREILRARGAGAAEIDAVLPWRALLAGDADAVVANLRAMREASQGLPLKVIIESGELGSHERIREASLLAIHEGADFIKTSTGKARVHATPRAAETMLEAIAETGGRCGFKAAGGIRTPDEANAYLAIADRVLGPAWCRPSRLRIGASSLAEALLPPEAC